ncbi:phosphatidylglycerophosphatase A family protein [Sulfitobacter guttiformis]|uniref:Phosphatidylglycerophosphatase A n=1 Tax=Sulfitobacter guttiformis TaxID=74349 RepID=A0A420DI53_9RHOB|nr:phosphatidylglycerophosphatase A [Sulfitobacter guttiformis]KIN72326.1 Phosphatidylglycerophosphatase A [Sulfitobacter guttiformis KCTC 32187]RKE93913.1 phosphatidylglycerophosphatase A [Sulfitobacter guttiformis]
MKLARMIGTVLGVGYLRPAPGTWGSLVALPWGWLIHVIGGLPLLVLAIVAAFLKGWWATSKMTAGSDDHDPSEIVIDEVVGQWIALLPLSIASWRMGIDITVMWPGWIAAFVLFRLFDIWKPWIVGWADRRGDPLGVMLDDVFAGIFSAIGVVVLAGVAHAL